MQQKAGDAWSRVKGFSYASEKESGLSRCTSTQSLAYLEREGYTLDVIFGIRQEGSSLAKKLIHVLYKLYDGLSIHHGCEDAENSPRLCHNGSAIMRLPKRTSLLVRAGPRQLK